jgi:cephalosporin-C deacetylase-like acetyl esterase
MIEPSDFGLGPVACMAHVFDGRRSSVHAPFWRTWDEALLEHRPALIERRTPDAGDGTATHEFESHNHVPIGCRLVEPSGEIRAGLLVLHGYDDVPTLADDAMAWAPMADRGVLVMLIRVRGYPGSLEATGNITANPRGYVTHGLDVPIERPTNGCAWILSGAVADVVNAWRALRDELDRRTADHAPIFMHASSFGAALALIATARIERVAGARDPVARLAIGLPSLGDWTWRIAHESPLGAGGQILALIRDLREYGNKIYRTLRLFDTAVHARFVRSPALCKLALRDEIVPAPTSAAVFNALRSPTGLKRRFVVSYGHFDGGLANARRHALYQRAVEAFLDPGVSDAVALSRADAFATEKLPSRDQGEPFGKGATSDAQDVMLIAAYERTGRTLDDLAHTDAFESIFASVGGERAGASRREVFHRLHNLRKAGRLPRLGAAASQPPRINADDEGHLRSLVIHAVGTMGQRDRLPYTPEYDALVERFNESTGHNLTAHDIWSLIARLAK